MVEILVFYFDPCFIKTTLEMDPFWLAFGYFVYFDLLPLPPNTGWYIHCQVEPIHEKTKLVMYKYMYQAGLSIVCLFYLKYTFFWSQCVSDLLSKCATTSKSL